MDTVYLDFSKAFDNFESINNRNLYKDFYDHLSEKFDEDWTWDVDTKSLAQGLYKSCTKFEHLVAFSVLFNGLEPVKPLAKKLQKRNQDIYTAYHNVDQVLTQLKSFRDNMDEVFEEWYDFAKNMGAKVGVEPSMPRIAPCWSRYRNNVCNDGPLDYYKKAIAIPVIDDLLNNLTERMKDRNLVDLFVILPSILVNKTLNLKSIAKEIYDKFSDELVDNDIAFFNELKRWKHYCAEKFVDKNNCTHAAISKPISSKPISKDK